MDVVDAGIPTYTSKNKHKCIFLYVYIDKIYIFVNFTTYT